MEYLAWGRSDVGRHRSSNQDSYYCDPEDGVFVVADGVGGKSDGDRASRLFAEHFADRGEMFVDLLESSDPVVDPGARANVFRAVEEAFEEVNRQILEEGDGEMATTGDVLLLGAGTGVVGHVGDSRVYLRRDDNLIQLTDDHTYAEALRKRTGAKSFKRSQIENYSHVLTRTIGGRAELETDTLFVDVQCGDRFLLCSDGVTDGVALQSIDELVRGEDGAEALRATLTGAFESETKDNATAIVVDVVEESTSTFHKSAPVDTIRKVSFLSQIDLFEGLDEGELLKILRIVFRRDLDSGETVVGEGETADEFYMVLEGEVSLCVDGEEVAVVASGEHFGELGLYGRPERSADAITTAPTTLLTVPLDGFRDLIEREPEMGNKLLRRLLEEASERLRSTTAHLVEARRD